MGAGDEDDLSYADGWLRIFVEQSIGDVRLEGDGAPLYARGGGRSGAQVVQVAVDEPGSIVLKRDTLVRAVKEAESRRGRALGLAEDSREARRFASLRARGASHVAIDAPSGWDGNPAELFGILAYEYVGKDSQSNEGVVDLQDFIRDRYIAQEEESAAQVRQTLNAVIGELFSDGSPRTIPDAPAHLGDTQVLLTELGLRESSTIAFRYVEARLPDQQDGVARLRTHLRRSWGRIRQNHPKPEFPDSRWIHGDPRLANVLVDPGNRGWVEIIDYGDGGPGGHVFKDLARLEIDILIRSTDVATRDECPGEVEHRAAALFRADEPLKNDDRRIDIARIWRDARNEKFKAPGLAAGVQGSASAVYWLFLVKELFRRLRWHSDELADAEKRGVDAPRDEADRRVGATLAELVAALQVLSDNAPE